MRRISDREGYPIDWPPSSASVTLSTGACRVLTPHPDDSPSLAAAGGMRAQVPMQQRSFKGTQGIGELNQKPCPNPVAFLLGCCWALTNLTGSGIVIDRILSMDPSSSGALPAH